MSVVRSDGGAAARPLRIAFIVDKSAPFYVGGYENRVFDLAQSLSRSHEVRILTSIDAATTRVGDVAFHRIAPTTFQREKSGRRSVAHSLIFSIALFRRPALFASWRPDVVMVEAIPYLPLFIGARWMNRRSGPVVVDVCEAWSEYPFRRGTVGRVATRIVHAVLRYATHRAARVVAISEATRNSLIRNYGIPGNRVVVVPLSVDLSAETGPAAGAVGPPRVDVLFLSRLVPEKRPQDLVAALKLLRDDHHWTGRAVLAGGGPMLEGIRRSVVDAGLSRQVEVPGFVDALRKDELLRSARTFVVPSEREGFSLAALEALSHGIPVVAARPPWDEVFGVGDIVHDGVEGLIYSLGEADQLAGAIQRILSEPELHARLSANAWKTARRYTRDEVSRSLEAVLLEAAGTLPAAVPSGERT
ncbi:MAG: glycosyltransferase family 4 protein [Thermoplasmata archaeon]|nr:glycosyltransferase family 4 protein [Thermoplasmata archaeon]